MNTSEQAEEDTRKLLCLRHKLYYYLKLLVLNATKKECEQNGLIYSYLYVLHNKYNENKNTEGSMNFIFLNSQIIDFLQIPKERQYDNIERVMSQLEYLKNIDIINDLLEFLIANTTDKQILKLETENSELSIRLTKLENKFNELEKSKVKVKKINKKSV